MDLDDLKRNAKDKATQDAIERAYQLGKAEGEKKKPVVNSTLVTSPIPQPKRGG